MEVQTRSEINGLSFYDSVQKAIEAAKNDTSIWKISFSYGSERIRLVKTALGFVYEPIDVSVLIGFRN